MKNADSGLCKLPVMDKIVFFSQECNSFFFFFES